MANYACGCSQIVATSSFQVTNTTRKRKYNFKKEIWNRYIPLQIHNKIVTYLQQHSIFVMGKNVLQKTVGVIWNGSTTDFVTKFEFAMEQNSVKIIMTAPEMFLHRH